MHAHLLLLLTIMANVLYEKHTYILYLHKGFCLSLLFKTLHKCCENILVKAKNKAEHWIDGFTLFNNTRQTTKKSFFSVA